MKNESERNFHKQHKKYDEYYTTKEEVEYLFNELINFKQLYNKIIYCPFDNNESEFVIYLKDNKEKIGYKELIYTSDDFRGHEDIFIKADFIISNPPFSLLHKEILPLLKRLNKQFFLFGSLSMIYTYCRTYNPNEIKYFRRYKFPFKTPFISDNTETNFVYVASTIYMTNMEVYLDKEIKVSKHFLSKSIKDIQNIREQDGRLVIDKMINFPNDYYDEVLCPITVAEYKYTKYFDYISINYYNSEKKDCHDYNLFNDGKRRFIRMIIKRKKNI